MLDDSLLEDLLNQSTTVAPPPPPDPRRRAIAVAALLALVPALLLGLVGLVGGVIVAAIVFVVVLVGVAAALVRLLLHSGDDRVLSAVGGRPADPVTDARLLNLVEGLCTATGLARPKVRVIDAEGLNALVAGRNPASATLAVTSRLVAELSRVELEAVLAEEVVNIRRGRMVAATVAASVPPRLARLMTPASRAAPVATAAEVEEDRAAVGLTRYPPGLIGALEKMRAQGTLVAAPASIDALWLADPSPATDSPRASLDRRIEALVEL